MVECGVSTFLTNFNYKLLVHFCPLFAGHFTIAPVSYFSELVDHKVR